MKIFDKTFKNRTQKSCGTICRFNYSLVERVSIFRVLLLEKKHVDELFLRFILKNNVNQNIFFLFCLINIDLNFVLFTSPRDGLEHPPGYTCAHTVY